MQRLRHAVLPAVLALAAVLSAGSSTTASAKQTGAALVQQPTAVQLSAVKTNKQTQPIAKAPLTSRLMSRRARRPATVTKLMVLVVENHSFNQMRAQMPYTAGLADRFGYATNYRALAHPSLPNYLAIVGGSTFGIRDDRAPSSHRLRARSVFGQALRSHRTARVYAEGMPRNCATRNGGHRYAVRHNPWTYFVKERKQCARYDVRLYRLAANIKAGRLPNAGMIIPNVCNDAHDCSLATADRWLHRRINQLMSGPDWRAGRLAIVVTADEDNHRQNNTVLTAVLHPSISHRVVRSRLTHYSLTRLYDEVLGTPFLRGAARAPSMAKAFGLPVA